MRFTIVVNRARLLMIRMSATQLYNYGRCMSKKTKNIRISVVSVFHPHTVVPAIATKAVSILDVSISFSQLLRCYLI